MRKIIHIDMDAFFAAVEQRERPELKGKPVAVGGSSQRGVVASASYEARQFGVRSAMPSVTAARICPGLVFVKSQFDLYRSISYQIRDIFFDYTDLVEPLSLDEAYLDVTINKKGWRSAMRVANDIRRRIENETNLTASAGVSFNKFLAKIASDINKPNGMKVILPEESELFLNELPIRKFHGIGKVTAQKMQRMGIYTGADLRKLSEIDMVRRFGKSGRHYYKMVRAQDERPVNPNRIRKSVGAERTFSQDLLRLEVMIERIIPIAEKVFEYMERTDNYGRTLSLKIKKSDFTILSRSRTFNREIRRKQDLLEATTELLKANFEKGMAVRLLGISISNLTKEDVYGGVQLEFDFDKEEEE